MATLTETAYYARNFIKYGLLTLFGLVIVRGAIIISVRIYKDVFPPPPPPPTVKYGKLPRLPISQFPNLPTTITYKLETLDGSASADNLRGVKNPAPGQAKVFVMPQGAPNLLSIERSKERAIALGFREDPELLDNSIYRFRNELAFATLDVHATTQTFHYIYSWQGNQSILGNPPRSTDDAQRTLENYLNSAGILADDLKNGKALFKFMRANGTGLSEVSSLSDADFVRVDLFRQDLDNLPIYTSNPAEGSVWGIVTGAGKLQGQIIEVVYRYFPVERQEFATYPIKSSAQAWQELGQGKGFVVSLGDNSNGNITIRRIYLAYLDVTLNPVRFMQPIYVFEGDNDFVAYVPAVADEWMQ